MNKGVPRPELFVFASDAPSSLLSEDPFQLAAVTFAKV